MAAASCVLLASIDALFLHIRHQLRHTGSIVRVVTFPLAGVTGFLVLGVLLHPVTHVAVSGITTHRGKRLAFSAADLMTERAPAMAPMPVPMRR